MPLLVLLALCGATPLAAQAGPLRAPALERATLAWGTEPVPAPAARCESRCANTARELGVGALSLAAGAAMALQGEEMRDSGGFPGAMLRYTGYTLVVAGVSLLVKAL